MAEASGSRIVLVGAVQCNSKKILESDGDCALLLRVALTECVREALDFHAKDDELIDRDFPRCWVVDLDQELNELLAKAETHLSESLTKLSFFDGTRLVAVISFEAIQPLVHVVEKFLELNDVNRAGFVLVKH